MREPRIGLIARDDSSGLAAQSLEFVNGLPITATLVVDLGDKGRGVFHGNSFPNSLTVAGPAINDLVTVTTFLSQVDVVLSIETFYGPMIPELAYQHKIPTVRYANPELYQPEGETNVVLPTTWQAERIGNPPVIRQGIALPDHRLVRDRSAQSLLHFSAPAMLDRNGTTEFHAALAHTKERFRAKIVGPTHLTYARAKHHQWSYEKQYVRDRFAWYTTDMDLLVLPRKYAGLCLPMLEAAAYGIPTITTDLAPQNGWFGPDCLVPALRTASVPMCGGRFNVYKADIEPLAERLDRFANESIKDISTQALDWAQTHSWEKVRRLWLEYLGDVC